MLGVLFCEPNNGVEDVCAPVCPKTGVEKVFDRGEGLGPDEGADAKLNVGVCKYIHMDQVLKVR